MWKVIAVDNYSRETVADFLICESIKSEVTAKIIVDAMREYYKGSDRWPILVEQWRPLWRGMEEFVL